MEKTKGITLFGRSCEMVGKGIFQCVQFEPDNLQWFGVQWNFGSTSEPGHCLVGGHLGGFCIKLSFLEMGFFQHSSVNVMEHKISC